MEWTRERIGLAMAGAAFFLTVTSYAVLFHPLQNKIHQKMLEAKSEEAKALEGRTMIEAMRRSRVRSGLLTATEVSLAVEELMRRGKELGIEFISMSPGEPAREPDADYDVLPVRMELVSSYEGLGFFLGLLDELDQGLATLREMAVQSDPRASSSVKTSLTLQLYLAGEKSAV